MANKLDFLTKELVDLAVVEIDRDGIPENRESVSYTVEINNKNYPFKLLVTEAAIIAGKDLSHNDFSSNDLYRSFFEDKTGYKCTTMDTASKYFKEIIFKLSDLLKEDVTILSQFSIKKESSKSKNWYWVLDHTSLIGNKKVHYELRKTSSGIFVELHFEGKKDENDIFQAKIVDLPNGLEWFKWCKSKSLRLKEPVDISSPNAVSILRDKLLQLENEIGDKVRAIIDQDIKDVKMMKASNNNKSKALNQILYGPPGTGKTYNTINKALEICEGDINNLSRSDIKERFNSKVESGQIVFTTFHQSMCYEDFIEGIKPQEPKEDGMPVTYKVVDGILKNICKKANEQNISKENFEEIYNKFLQEIEDNSGSVIHETLVHSKEFTVYCNSKGNLKFHANTEKAYEGVIRKDYLKHYLETGEAKDWPSYIKAVGNYFTEKLGYIKESVFTEKPYVLIIDEINRGNVSAIFGELITLIEDDKRIGNSEALEVTLPYSKAKFGVPANLYIIGTMNTADRSVEALDTALRRRFSFQEMPPKPVLITTEGKLKDQKGILEGIDLPKLLETINERIERLVDKDHKIGHSYFMSVSSLKDLKLAFQNKIIPLLQEYFFGDYGKIGLVIGEAFFENKGKQERSSNIFASFNGYDSSVFMDRPVYCLLNVSDMKDSEFIEAITTLNPNLMTSPKNVVELAEQD
jgi:Cdc6-like AAA superfamily ATPase